MRDGAERVTPSRSAASVTVSLSSSNTSSHSVSPGCGGLKIRVMIASVIVLVVEENCIGAIKGERDAPVAIDFHRIMAGKILSHRMQPPAR